MGHAGSTELDEEGEGETTAAFTVQRTSQGALVIGNRLPGLSLLVLREAGISTVPLPTSGEVVLGRGVDADVRLDDPKLSRRHVTVRVGARVEVLDLGSLNGTFVGGKQLTPHEPLEVGPGDSISIGSAMLVLQSASAASRPRHIWAHGYFEARLEEECARAAEGAASFAVVRVRVEVEAHRAKAEEVLAAWLRVADTVGAYAPGDYEVLRIKSTTEEVERGASELRVRLAAAGVRARTGISSYPRDGRTPEALVAHAGRELMGASPAGASSQPGPVVAFGAMARLAPLVDKVAASTINVLVLGETGVGKEVLARRIHERSPRAAKPLVSLNCAALSESLLESELFGHEKGAFTGALAAKAGLLESADGGTVFLDEIGEMPLAIQAKLLRVLEQREVTRVGALRPRSIDVRFVAATNRDPELEVQKGRFRQDLYFRLNGISVALPPLRERVDEIEPLARAFAADAARRLGRPAEVRLDDDALDLLLQYQWPGNIRELRNVMERAIVLSSGAVVTAQHLPVEKMGPVLAVPASARPSALAHGPGALGPSPTAGAFAATSAVAAIRPTSIGSAAPLAATLPPPAPSPPAFPAEDGAVASSARGIKGAQPFTDDERQLIVQALERCAGNQTHAARLLGVSRRTLISRIEAYDLPRPRKRTDP